MPTNLPELGRVDIWTAHTDPSLIDSFGKTLSTVERRRSEEFVFEKHRVRYIFSQGLLRDILARYLHTEPYSIIFQKNAYGKPSLDRTLRAILPLSFNLSNSGDLAVVAVTLGRAVGVDTEFIRGMEDIGAIAQHYFTEEERSLLETASPQLRAFMFYTCWTRKEACIKAVGKGLSIRLNSFDTSMPLNAVGRQVSLDLESLDIKEWWLTDLSMPDGYVGAMAIQGKRPNVTYLRWNGYDFSDFRLELPDGHR
jgi:4'-phosphopantetheinyl transferase